MEKNNIIVLDAVETGLEFTPSNSNTLYSCLQ